MKQILAALEEENAARDQRKERTIKGKRKRKDTTEATSLELILNHADIAVGTSEDISCIEVRTTSAGHWAMARVFSRDEGAEGDITYTVAFSDRNFSVNPVHMSSGIRIENMRRMARKRAKRVNSTLEDYIV